MSLRCLATEPHFPKFSDLKQRLEGHARFGLIPLKGYRDVVDALAKDPVGIWLAYAPDRQRLVEVLAALRLLRQAIQDGDAKVIVTITDRNPLVARKLIESGAHEVLVEPVTAKTIEAKLNRLAATLGLEPEQSAEKHDSKKKRSTVAVEQEPRKNSQAPSREVEWLPALSGSYECWVFAKHDVRWTMGTWVSLLTGPTPTDGEWVGQEDPRTGEGEWVWSFAEREQTFCQEQGSWHFIGRRPEFRGDHWALIGERPELVFKAPGQPDRIKLAASEGGGFSARENSDFAKALLPKLRDNMERLLRLKETPETEGPDAKELERHSKETESELTERARRVQLRQDSLAELEEILEKSTAPSPLEIVMEEPRQDSDEYMRSLDEALGPVGRGPRLGLLGLAFFLSEISAVARRTTRERQLIAERLFRAALGGHVEFHRDRVVLGSQVELSAEWREALMQITQGLRATLASESAENKKAA